MYELLFIKSTKKPRFKVKHLKSGIFLYELVGNRYSKVERC